MCVQGYRGPLLVIMRDTAGVVSEGHSWLFWGDTLLALLMAVNSAGIVYGGSRLPF